MLVKPAFAALTFALLPASEDGKAPAEVHLLPPGPFRPDDGRELDVRAWQLDAVIASRLIEKIRSRRVDTVIDYEHQSISAEKNGQPAPAAGWFRDLEWCDAGLFAVGIKWTARAAAAIEAKEYRYASTVFRYDPKTGEVLEIISFALTNTPALHGLGSLIALSRLGDVSLGNPQPEENSMEKDKAIAELTARVGALAGKNKEKDSNIAALTAKVADLTKQLADVEAEKTKAAVEAEAKEKASIIEAMLSAQQIYPTDRESLVHMPLDALKTFAEGRKGMTLLTRQTDGNRPDDSGDDTHGLTEEELAICTRHGFTAEGFATAKKSIAS